MEGTARSLCELDLELGEGLIRGLLFGGLAGVYANERGLNDEHGLLLMPPFKPVPERSKSTAQTVPVAHCSAQLFTKIFWRSAAHSHTGF